MTDVRAGTPEQATFLAALLERGLLIDSGVPGVYGRGAAFEDVRLRFDALVSAVGAEDGAERVHHPPVLPRRHLETADYLHSFPHLAGTVFGFEGSETQAATQRERARRHEDWSEFQAMTELVLVPAACYPVYPAVAARGPLGDEGVTIDAGDAYVFRHEPAEDPARLQSFHQREIVRIGPPEAVTAWRSRWLARALEMLRGLGLQADSDVAADPFFGRGGRMLAANQRAQELKLEIMVPIAGPEATAVASFNYHHDHFASSFGIVLAGGGPVHTACLGFGEERIVLALLHRHGLDVQSWPADVRDRLWDA